MVADAVIVLEHMPHSLAEMAWRCLGRLMKESESGRSIVDTKCSALPQIPGSLGWISRRSVRLFFPPSLGWTSFGGGLSGLLLKQPCLPSSRGCGVMAKVRPLPGSRGWGPLSLPPQAASLEAPSSRGWIGFSGRGRFGDLPLLGR